MSFLFGEGGKEDIFMIVLSGGVGGWGWDDEWHMMNGFHLSVLCNEGISFLLCGFVKH